MKLAIVAVLLGLFVGAGLLAGASAGMAATNTEPFCIGCHEMKDNVYAEYKGTIHDSNRSGVRATCPDCHVPHEIGPKIIRKIEASGELWGSITGKLDTKEKFEKHRYELARNEWVKMKETDSRECRNCHSREGMSKDLQTERAWARHVQAKADGMTCIECHFGIAHTEPDGPGPKELFAKQPK
ncbi:MAG TPA: NapC/NirT family cytochrome c [Rhizobacter sp.]|nr:NapC/NirT family cytochrome c [Rhizobacter sp.]